MARVIRSLRDPDPPPPVPRPPVSVTCRRCGARLVRVELASATLVDLEPAWVAAVTADYDGGLVLFNCRLIHVCHRSRTSS